jgi:serine/threonine protein kinase
LIHRDIKPANVILFRRGRRPDIAKLLDFGLVHDAEQATDAVPNVTLAGTPAFMAPESFQAPAQVDARSDLYAVGALGYFLLTGEYIFEGQNVASYARQHAVQRPDSPGARLGRPFDAQLSALLMKCLEKDPENRPQSAAELSKALAACDIAASWTRDEANRWWDAFHLEQAELSSAAEKDKGDHSENTVTFVA